MYISLCVSIVFYCVTFGPPKLGEVVGSAHLCLRLCRYLAMGDVTPPPALQEEPFENEKARVLFLLTPHASGPAWLDEVSLSYSECFVYQSFQTIHWNAGLTWPSLLLCPPPKWVNPASLNSLCTERRSLEPDVSMQSTSALVAFSEPMSIAPLPR